MINILIRFVISLGVRIAAFLTVVSLLTPLYPPVEIINHFRPFMIASIVILFVLSYVMDLRSSSRFASALIILFNTALILPSTLYTSYANRDHKAEAIKLVSFNALISNNRLEKTKNFLLQEDADIVVFQEFGYTQEKLLNSLKEKYPYQFSCARNISCLMAIISKRQIERPYVIRRTSRHPPLISANFTTKSGKSFKVMGTHISWPLSPFNQDIDMKWLAEYARKEKMPLIVAGDFNHTPWSWRLTRFSHDSGLKRHGTFMASWPAHILFPGFLIDHVFSSKDVKNIKNSVGPNLNSDHFPIISVFEIK